MIERIHFENFKVLRDSTLPLSRVTLIVGPNGSGKSTCLQALESISSPGKFHWGRLVWAGARGDREATARVTVHWTDHADQRYTTTVVWTWDGPTALQDANFRGERPPEELLSVFHQRITRFRLFTLNASSILKPVTLSPYLLLSETGEGLAGILDKLRDQDPERFELLNRELQIWMPEFDRILFETPQESMRSFLLRSREGQFKIGAHDLSQGTLLALAILTMAYLPDPPPIVAMEEPDRGIHPRLLRHVKDAIYRLAYPESVGEKRDPAQVIVTTHSPYMLDLFRDRPEDIVIAEKVEDNVQFHRLSERKDLDEILENIHLGDAWYSGILGGVPAEK
jgi:predicted ATPase